MKGRLGLVFGVLLVAIGLAGIVHVIQSYMAPRRATKTSAIDRIPATVADYLITLNSRYQSLEKEIKANNNAEMAIEADILSEFIEIPCDCTEQGLADLKKTAQEGKPKAREKAAEFLTDFSRLCEKFQTRYAKDHLEEVSYLAKEVGEHAEEVRKHAERARSTEAQREAREVKRYYDLFRDLSSALSLDSLMLPRLVRADVDSIEQVLPSESGIWKNSLERKVDHLVRLGGQCSSKGIGNAQDWDRFQQKIILFRYEVQNERKPAAQEKWRDAKSALPQF
ncbi:MAG: hypothetical protein V2A74_11970 [bacterium]